MKPSSARILELLRERPQGLTSLDALASAGCWRLGARIWDLRAEGYEIESKLVTTPSGKHVAKYVLLDPPMQLDARL